jgi:hypothetical protein
LTFDIYPEVVYTPSGIYRRFAKAFYLF